MATTIAIEEESGTYRRHLHTHNGYYAGDFSMDAPSPATWTHFSSDGLQ